MKRFFVSIASHHSEDLIIKNFAHFPKMAKDFEVIVAVIDNIGSKKLEDFCKQKGFFYLHDGKKRGFGANHNKVFEFFNPKDEDLFLVSDPDIFLPISEMEGMLEAMQSDKEADILNIRSYLNKEKNILDCSDRYFPGILNFFISFLTGKRLHYGKNKDVKYPEWMSGGFMLFRASSYRKLNGFDEDFFMYCEDIDICYRAKKVGMILKHDNRFYNEHDSRMASRKLFSKSMFWHIKTAFLFVYKHRFYKLITFAKS